MFVKNIKPARFLRGFDNEIKIIFELKSVWRAGQLWGNRVYFSPERLSLWNQKKDLPENQQDKSNAFSIGLIILQMSNPSFKVEDMQHFNREKHSLHEELITFSKKYKRLSQVLEKLLCFYPKGRFDLLQAYNLMVR